MPSLFATVVFGSVFVVVICLLLFVLIKVIMLIRSVEKDRS